MDAKTLAAIDARARELAAQAPPVPLHVLHKIAAIVTAADQEDAA